MEAELGQLLGSRCYPPRRPNRPGTSELCFAQRSATDEGWTVSVPRGGGERAVDGVTRRAVPVGSGAQLRGAQLRVTERLKEVRSLAADYYRLAETSSEVPALRPFSSLASESALAC